MKKVLVSIITSFLLITTMPVCSIFAEDKLEEKNLTLSPEVIKAIEKLDPSKNTGFINSIQSVIGVATTFGPLFTTYNGIYNFLKSIGVIESPEQASQKVIINKLEDIQDSINDMNDKLDGIVEELDKNFAEVDLDFDDIKVRLDKQNVNAFYTNYELTMINRLSNFENTLNTKIKTWFVDPKQDICLPISYKKSKNDTLITFDNIDKISQEVNQDKTKYVEISINAELLNKVFKDAIWNNTTYEEDINVLLKEYFNSAFTEEYEDIYMKKWELEYLLENIDNVDFDESVLVDEDTIDNAWSTYVKTNTGYIDELATGFASNFNQALMNFFYLQICEENKGETSQYVNEVCNEFRNYCNMLTNSDGSPYINQLDILPMIYLFQKETKNIVDDLRSYYICNLTKYAIFYLGVMKACDIADYEGYVSLYNNAIEKMIKHFDSFLIKDSNGTIMDNYCYMVSAPIEIEDVYFNQTVKVYHEQYENKMFGIDYEVYNGHSQTPWKFSEPNSNIVNNQDMLKICALYKYLHSENQSLNSYLQDNMYGEEKYKYVDWIVTGFEGSKSFSLSDKVMMSVHGIGRNTFFKNVYSKYINDDSNEDIDDAGFVIHDAAVVDTFDLNSFVNTTGSKLLYRALFAEHSSGWFKDEMAICAPKIMSSDYRDIQTSEKDGHRYYTFEYGGNYAGYYAIKKTNNLSKEMDGIVDYTNLNDASSLNINNTTKYFEQNDVDRPYVMYFDENEYLNNNDSDVDVINGFKSYVNDNKFIESVEDKNKSVMNSINSIELFKDGYYDANLSKDTINKIIKEMQSSISSNKDSASLDALMSLKDMPSINDDCNVVISVIYLPIIRIDKDSDSFHFSIVDAYVLRPYLVWNDNDKYIEITDSTIQKLGLVFNVKIPSLNKEKGMNRARINHYANKYDLNEPIETLTGKVSNDYIEFKTKSFSPFIVDSYYKENPYLPVKTGIE